MEVTTSEFHSWKKCLMLSPLRPSTLILKSTMTSSSRRYQTGKNKPSIWNRNALDINWSVCVERERVNVAQTYSWYKASHPCANSSTLGHEYAARVFKTATAQEKATWLLKPQLTLQLCLFWFIHVLSAPGLMCLFSPRYVIWWWSIIVRTSLSGATAVKLLWRSVTEWWAFHSFGHVRLKS